LILFSLNPFSESYSSSFFSLFPLGGNPLGAKENRYLPEMFTPILYFRKIFRPSPHLISSVRSLFSGFFIKQNSPTQQQASPLFFLQQNSGSPFPVSPLPPPPPIRHFPNGHHPIALASIPRIPFSKIPISLFPSLPSPLRPANVCNILQCQLIRLDLPSPISDISLPFLILPFFCLNSLALGG